MARDIIRLNPVPAPLPDVPLPAAPELRLRLAPDGAGRGGMDGGWWPRSRDPIAELTDLVIALAEPLGTATRLTVDLDDWDDVPRRIAVHGRGVKVGWLPNLDHLVAVSCGRADPVLLLVVPPEAAQGPAEAALARAAVETGDVTPREILASCDISTARTRD
jgi:hypothetical protein